MGYQDIDGVVVVSRPRQQSLTHMLTSAMDQKKPRPKSLAVSPQFVTAVNNMSYHRALSPGGRRMTNPGRASDSNFDPYYSQRHTAYASPRTSTGNVVPISTQTYLNLPSTNSTGGSNRPVSGYDSYSGRPRRSSLVDSNRGTSGSTNQYPPRSRPTVVQDNARPSSPSRRDRDYYITPATSKEKDSRKFEHKKLYSVDDGNAKLVADVDMSAGRHHRRKESGDVERGGYRSLPHDRGRKPYHANGKSTRTVDDDDAFSYTDPASMYKDTEPRWRPETRPRRGSVDRGGASRERPVSMIDQFGDPRRSSRDVGPPPSQRGWNKIMDIGRSHSQRDPTASIARSPSRGRDERYADPRDPYYVPPRRNSTDRSNKTAAVHQDRPAERRGESFPDFEERRPRHERRLSGAKPGDRSVSRRGFGIRPESQDRWGAQARGSDESLEQRKRDLARDSGYVPPPPDSDFTEPDRRRVLPDEPIYREPRRRDHERSYDDFDRDSDRDRDRDRPREKHKERDRERHHHRRDTDRDHDRKDSDKEDSNGIAGATKIAAPVLAGAAALFGLNREKDKKEEREREKAEKAAEREREEKREREREEKRERERELEWEREREQERARESERLRELERRPEPERSIRFDDRRERDNDSEKRRRGDASRSDEPPFERQRDPYAENDRGLGFAYEGSSEAPKARDAPREAPRESTREVPQVPPPQPPRDYDREPRERGSDRESDRPYEQPLPPAGTMPPAGTIPPAGTMPPPAGAVPSTAMDPDADYRRRMEQVQRELGLPQDHSFSSDSDPDRERRRREREQRQAERQERMGGGSSNNRDNYPSNPDPSAGYGYSDGPGNQPSIPGSYRNFDGDDASVAPSQSTWSEAPSSTTQGLKRRPSILDRSMDQGNMAQIIDNSASEKRENRVRIVDPPTDEDDKRPKGILKRPTEKFPEDPNAVREGVAPLKDANKKGIPPGARWTKIDRRLVNPEALEDAKERFEERLDFVIVLRVLTKEEIQKLADRTRELREKRQQEERAERKSSRRRDRNRDREGRDEFEDDSENEFKPKPTRMLEAPSTVGGASNAGTEADFRERRDRDRERDREREREPQYMSSGRGGRE